MATITKIGVNGASGQLGAATVKHLLERAAGQHNVVASGKYDSFLLVPVIPKED